MFEGVLKNMLAKAGLRLQRNDDFRLINFLRKRNVDVVFDIGANEGQFGSYLRRKGFEGLIKSFEPLPSAFDVLQKRSANDERWQAFNVAVGARAGTEIMHQHAFSPMSSLKQPKERWAETAMDVPVSVDTFDNLSKGHITSRSFLKVDTQGFEEQVLRGGTSSLSVLLGVQLELPVVHLYDGVWRLADAIRFMEQAGFVPAQFHPVTPHPQDATAVVEVDCIFRRIDASLDS